MKRVTGPGITSLEPNHDCTDADGNLERGISFFREFPQDKLLCPSHLRENEMVPRLATHAHAILTVSKAGESVFQTLY